MEQLDDELNRKLTETHSFWLSDLPKDVTHLLKYECNVYSELESLHKQLYANSEYRELYALVPIEPLSIHCLLRGFLQPSFSAFGGGMEPGDKNSLVSTVVCAIADSFIYRLKRTVSCASWAKKAI